MEHNHNNRTATVRVSYRALLSAVGRNKNGLRFREQIQLWGADSPDPDDFLFIRTNPRGHHFERWRHINGCARFFNAVRETVSDRFLTTYKAGEPRPDLGSLTGGQK